MQASLGIIYFIMICLLNHYHVLLLYKGITKIKNKVRLSSKIEMGKTPRMKVYKSKLPREATSHMWLLGI